MTRIPLLALGALLVTGLAVAAEPREKFRMLEVSELESMQKDPKSPPTLLDANDGEFRAKNGIIPGAKLPSSSDRYDLANELPADRNAPLVFSCSSRLERPRTRPPVGRSRRDSLEAGFTRVAVLAPGLKGWKDAGKPTARP